MIKTDLQQNGDGQVRLELPQLRGRGDLALFDFPAQRVEVG